MSEGGGLIEERERRGGEREEKTNVGMLGWLVKRGCARFFFPPNLPHDVLEFFLASSLSLPPSLFFLHTLSSPLQCTMGML